MIGQTIRDYHIIEELGAGGFGLVYKAHEEKLGRFVALKMILPQYANDPSFQSRFSTEAQVIAQLQSPHIVPLHAYWQDDTGTYLVMRFIEGGSLRSYLDKQQALALHEIRRFLQQLTEALTIAHEAHVIHRDLKPENILLDKKGNAYLSDFGIAKQLNLPSNLTPSGGIVGSWKYLSPEQILNQDLSPASDIYSLGLMLYEMLSGKHPYEGMSSAAMLTKHLNETLPNVCELRTILPPAINTVLQKATAKNPNERYAVASELFVAFEAALADQAPSPKLPEKQSFPEAPKGLNAEQRQRHTMLEQVHRFWIEGVLEQSLYQAVQIELGMHAKADAVENPWHTLLKVPNAAVQKLPIGTSILDVYEQLQGKILILGEPGSGKTTTLLSLTRDLLQRALWDKDAPMPVIFNLSSWADKRKPLEEWLIDELNSRYLVSKKLGKNWLEAEQILLLLDGLDEVAAAYRNDCVVAINDYRNAHGFVDMVVCSRIADYQALSQRLMLNGAIVLEPLEREQVDSYLAQAGSSMDAVRFVLDDDAKLREITRSPLMLNILMLAYQGLSLEEIKRFDSIAERRKHIFSTYVARVLERKGTQQAYSPEKTQQYLSWLARRMSEHEQSSFFIENMQPNWLQARQRLAYAGGLPCFTALAGALFFIFQLITFIVLLYLWTSINFVFRSEFYPWLTFPALVAVLLLAYSQFRKRIQQKPISWSRFRWFVTFDLLYFLFLIILFILQNPLTGLLNIIIYGLSFAVPGAILGLYASIAYFFKPRIVAIDAVKWSWQKAIPNALIWAVLLAMVVGTLFTGLSSVVAFITCFGDDCAAYFSQLGYSWNAFSLSAINGAVAGATAGGLLGGLSGATVEDRKYANQGIRRSGQFASIIAIVSTVIVQLSIMILSIFSIAGSYLGPLFQNRTIGWPALAIVLLGFVPFVGMLLGLNKGGYATIQHLSLRVALWRPSVLPLNLAKFLDFASERILLRRVGGGYIFIHRLLLDYFANLGKETKAEEDSASVFGDMASNETTEGRLNRLLDAPLLSDIKTVVVGTDGELKLNPSLPDKPKA